MTPYNLVNIDSGNGMLPDNTKPLPGSMLINHQWGLVAFTWGQFHGKCSRYVYLLNYLGQFVFSTFDCDEQMLNQGEYMKLLNAVHGFGAFQRQIEKRMATIRTTAVNEISVIHILFRL